MSSSKRIRHRVEYTQNKHSRAVFADGTIIIRLAKNLSKTEKEEHVRDLLRRMTKQVMEEEQKIIIDPFRPILNGAQSLTITLASGKKYQIILKPGKKTSARRTTRGWSVTISPHIRRKNLHSFLWKLLAKAEERRIRTLVHMINDETFCYPLRKIRLKIATSQWGSCSSNKVIMLNAALLFTPPSILKYLIVHELSHLRYGNHSASYWRNVEDAMPTYKRAKEMIKNYRLPNL